MANVAGLLKEAKRCGFAVVLENGRPKLKPLKNGAAVPPGLLAELGERRAEVIAHLQPAAVRRHPDPDEKPAFLALIEAWDPDEFRERREAARAVSAAGSKLCGRVDGVGDPPPGVGCWVVGLSTEKKKPRHAQVWVKPGDVPPAWATLWCLPNDKTWTRFPGADARRGDRE